MSQSRPKHWLAISVATQPESAEAVSAVLFGAGALGCEEREHRLVGYFEDQAPEPLLQQVQAGLQRIREAGLPLPEKPPEWTRFPEEDWQAAWRQFFKPVRIAGKLIVRPPWERAEVPPGGVEIVIEPPLTSARVFVVLEEVGKLQQHPLDAVFKDIAADVQG